MEICIKNKKRPGGVAQVVEHLPNKREALSSNYSADKKKKRKKSLYWRFEYVSERLVNHHNYFATKSWRL
jgi:dipeptidase